MEVKRMTNDLFVTLEYCQGVVLLISWCGSLSADSEGLGDEDVSIVFQRAII